MLKVAMAAASGGVLMGLAAQASIGLSIYLTIY
jgi:hypothetical protein